MPKRDDHICPVTGAETRDIRRSSKLRRSSLYDDSFYEYGKGVEREEMVVLVTTKYSRDPFVGTKSEPAARSPAERGAR